MLWKDIFMIFLKMAVNGLINKFICWKEKIYCLHWNFMLVYCQY